MIFSKKTFMLKIDFYESGIGDTTVITFPDGGVGVVDANRLANPPSASKPLRYTIFLFVFVYRHCFIFSVPVFSCCEVCLIMVQVV
jgi:hypothetical protein